MKTERPCPKCSCNDFKIEIIDNHEEFKCCNCDASYSWADAWDSNFQFISLRKGESYHFINRDGNKIDLIVNHIDNSLLGKILRFFKNFY